jgi:hypothetical protein
MDRRIDREKKPREGQKNRQADEWTVGLDNIIIIIITLLLFHLFIKMIVRIS